MVFVTDRTIFAWHNVWVYGELHGKSSSPNLKETVYKRWVKPQFLHKSELLYLREYKMGII